MASRPKSCSLPRASAYASSIEQRAAERRLQHGPRAASRSGRRSRRRGASGRSRRGGPWTRSPSVRRIWLSSRATVVLPVPGLPVNTRWWLVSIVGRPRSSRRRWIRSRLVSRRTSALTVGEPDERVELGEQLLDRARPAAGRPGAAAAVGAAPPVAAAAGRRRPASPARAGRAGRRRRRRTPAAARRGSRRWRRSRRATARGRSTPRRGRGARRRRSSGRRGAVPSRASARTSRSNSVLGRSSHARRPSSSPLSRSCSDDTRTGGSSREPMSSSHASSSAADCRLVAVDHGGDDVAGLDRRLRRGGRGPTARRARRSPRRRTRRRTWPALPARRRTA